MKKILQKAKSLLLFFTILLVGTLLYFTGSFDPLPKSSPLPQLRIIEREAKCNNGPLSFVVMGDMRWQSAPRKALLAAAQQEDPSFLVNLADVTILARAKEWQRYISELEEGWNRQIPYYHLPGGHSYNIGWRGRIPRFYNFYFGKNYYARENENWLFLFLDTGLGSISEHEYSWLRGKLARARGKKVIIFMHHPLFSEKNGVRHALSEKESGRLYQVIQKNRVVAIFAAHIHKTFVYNWHAIPVYVTALNEQSWQSEPAYYRVVKVGSKDIDVVTRELAKP